DRVVRLSEDGLGDVPAHLLAVDVERGHDLDVMDVVRTQDDVHESGDPVAGGGVLVELQSLHQGGGAVAGADDGQPDRFVLHQARSFWATGRGGATVRRRRGRADRLAGADPGCTCSRSAWIRSSSHRMSVSVAASSWFMSDSV